MTRIDFNSIPPIMAPFSFGGSADALWPNRVFAGHGLASFEEISHRESLRDIEICLCAMRPALYHMGIRSSIPTNTSTSWTAISSYVLVAILSKQSHLDHSLYTILQILSASLFRENAYPATTCGVEAEWWRH